MKIPPMPPSRWQKTWQKTRKPLVIILIIVLILTSLIVLIYAGYGFTWPGTGFGPETSEPKQHAKTLWDWMQLLIIPLVLAVGGYLFNLTISRNQQKSIQLRDQTEREIASDNQQEAALQAFIDKMSVLLLDKNLRESGKDDEVRKIARVQTLTVLLRLNAGRKRSLLQFLYESGLIDKDKLIIDLTGANLREADLYEADLHSADLHGANLIEARLHAANLRLAILVKSNLSKINLYSADLYAANLAEALLYAADLRRADLREAILMGAFLYESDFTEAILTGADLTRADLRRANITLEQLAQAKSITGAIMPDGSTHP